MEEIFSKIDFSPAPGGNLYHWKNVDTVFEIFDDGKYIIEISASAKNAQQNMLKDDDDLRISIDDYEFGKYEINDESISWKGFGTASSWDGATLKGKTKTVYFFLQLQKGIHKIKFYADNTPVLKKIRILSLNSAEKFELEQEPPFQNIKLDKNGLPWISFIFLGIKPKDFFISSFCKSAKQKNGTDGDNLKVILNGKILE